MPRYTNKREGYTPADDYYTPKWIFDDLGVEFDLDVASSTDSSIVVPAKRRYTIEDDGLTQPWIGRVWMNPPYSNSTPWIDKFMDHGNGIALVQTSKSNAFIRLWNEVDGMMYLPRNIMFVHKEHGKKGIFMPVALFAMGEANVQAMQASGINRVR